MAECFWTDLVGTSQELCGPADPGGYFFVAQAAYGNWGGGAFMLAPVHAYMCDDEISNPPIPLAKPAYGYITDIKVYRWMEEDDCAKRVLLACGADGELWEAFHYGIGPSPRLPAPVYLGSLPNRPALVLDWDGDLSISSVDTNAIEYAAAIAFGGGMAQYKLTIETDLGVFDAWVLRSGCY